MNIEDWQDRIKLLAPVFNQRVSGAASLAAIDKKSIPLMPACFVIPLTEKRRSPAGISSAVRSTFLVDYTVAVVTVDKNAADAVGGAVQSNLKAARAQIRNALCGWKASDMTLPVTWETWRLAEFNNMIVVCFDVFAGQESFTVTGELRCNASQ